MKDWNEYDCIRTLDSIIEGSIPKYEYNLARYLNKPEVDIKNYNEYSSWDNTGFSMSIDSDLLGGPNFNVIKSVIDSLVSKLSENKTRPFFNSVDGNYFTKKTVKQCQLYFDHLFEKIDMDAIVAQAFRNACIFGIGYIFIDPITWEVSSAPTWQVAMLNSEEVPTKLLIKKTNMSSMFFSKYGLEIDTNYADFAMFIDTVKKQIKLYVNGFERKKFKYNSELPIVPVYYNKPIYGYKTTSIADELEGIQTHIDLINSKLSACAQLTPGMTVYVDSTGNLKPSDINNRTGNIFELIQPVGATKLPVEYVNPAPHDPQWINELDFYVQKAYDMIGISQLSAQSRKPSGLNSGAALQTMEDIESDRFNTQVSHYIRAYTETAKKIIAVLPDDKDILETDNYKTSLKWSDVKKESNLFRVQYSAMSALSKDPAEKLKQLLEMSQVGLIGADKIAIYMDIPDLEDAYSNAAAVKNGIETVITRAIEQGIYDIPVYINYAELSKEIATQQNVLFSSIDPKRKDNIKVLQSIERLNQLDNLLMDIMQTQGFIDPTATLETATANSGLAASSQVNQANAGVDTLQQ